MIATSNIFLIIRRRIECLLTKCGSCADEEKARIELPVGAVHELGQLQNRERDQEEHKAGGSDVVERGDGVELDSTLLQKDLD